MRPAGDDAGREPDLGAELAALLAGRARCEPGLVHATVRLCHREREAGNVCIALADWQHAQFDDTAFPAVAAWRAHLLASGVCAAAAEPVPAAALVLDASDRLYLRRHYVDERRIAAAVATRLGAPLRVEPAALRRALDDLGLLPPAGALDWQVAAIAAAAARPFTVLTGGPGTGKTTTVARLLAVLERLEPGFAVALAAPTGKAAARLAEALAAHAAAAPALVPVLARVTTCTLHRLLGYLALEDAFRYGRDQSLPHDLVVVDEASMADPAVLAQLFLALRPTARVLLVGDRDQLAAVAAGQVLGDICRAAAPERGAGPGLSALLRAATGMQAPARATAPAIADAVVALRKNHRFATQPGIGAFTTALAAREPATAMAALAAGHRDLVCEPDPERALALVLPALLAAVAERDPETALLHLRRCRVLCATRHGPSGAEAWNRRIELALRRAGVPTDGPFYAGRPVLVTQNDHQNEIWNGDLGVGALVDGRPCVVFPGPHGRREVPIQRLPAHVTAYAMTVHKAQGSEFDEVLLAMPDQPGPLWQASLVYTGVSRARQRAIVAADPELLRAALGIWPDRGSGLAEALAE